MPASPGLNGKAGCAPGKPDATNWTSTAAPSVRTSLRFQPASSPAGWKAVRSACRKPSPERTYRNQQLSLSFSAPSCNPASTSCGSGRHAHQRHRCVISASPSRCWKKLHPISTCAPSPAKTWRTSNGDFIGHTVSRGGKATLAAGRRDHRQQFYGHSDRGSIEVQRTAATHHGSPSSSPCWASRSSSEVRKRIALAGLCRLAAESGFGCLDSANVPWAE